MTSNGTATLTVSMGPRLKSEGLKKSHQFTQQPTPDKKLVIATVRYSQNAFSSCWIVTDDRRIRVLECFRVGLMENAVFETGVPFKHCGKKQSTADATGELRLRRRIPEFYMPSDASYVAPLGFSPTEGFVIKGTEFVVTYCDYLLLRLDGSSILGWKERPAGAPDLAAT